MADVDIDIAVKRRARIALELGRVRWAIALAIPAALVAALFTWWLEGTSSSCTSVGVAVGALALAAGWKSASCLAGSLAGVALGVVPFIAMHALGVSTLTACCEACGGGGLFAGIAIGFFARRARFAVDAVAGACAGAALHAAMGCAHVGALEILGLVVGVVAGAAPVLALARRSAAHAS
jgi:hypothetical protein